MKKTGIFLDIGLPACLLGAVFLCLLPGIVLSAENTPTPAEVIDRMQLVYEGATTIVADFSQEVMMRAAGTKKMEKGVCFFKRPLKMRWAYQEPRQKLLVVGSKFSWFYLPDKKIAYRHPTAALTPSQTVLRLLAGSVDIRKDFQVELEGTDASGYTLQLKPLEKAANIGTQTITLLLDKDSFLIKRCAFDDLYGNRNTLTFGKIRINEELSDSLFAFRVPAGVQVVKME